MVIATNINKEKSKLLTQPNIGNSNTMPPGRNKYSRCTIIIRKIFAIVLHFHYSASKENK